MTESSITVIIENPRVDDPIIGHNGSIHVQLGGINGGAVRFADRVAAVEFALDLLRKVGNLPSRYDPEEETS